MPDDVASKRPASQYYWGDWFKDLALQSCSLAARGLWHEMNCLQHQGEPYGHLTLPNGKPMGPMQLANLCKIPAPLCRRLLEELVGNGVPSVDEVTGALYSRRMVRDEAARQAWAQTGREHGEKGKKFGALGAEHGVKGGRPKRVLTPQETPPITPTNEPAENPPENPPPKPGEKPPKNPPSSSSSSSVFSPNGLVASVTADPSAVTNPVGLPPCPFDRIVEAYHELLPELPRVRLLSEDRRKAVRSLWRFALTEPKSDGNPRATNADEAILWVRSYFQRARDNDWLMGRTPKVNGHTGWECDLDFLLSKKGLKQVIEKTREQHH